MYGVYYKFLTFFSWLLFLLLDMFFSKALNYGKLLGGGEIDVITLPHQTSYGWFVRPSLGRNGKKGVFSPQKSINVKSYYSLFDNVI